MAVDISEQLSTIEENDFGESVRNAIADAMLVLYTDDGLIDDEVEAIRHSCYGLDIRVAVHNALYKLSQYEPEPGPTPPTPPTPPSPEPTGSIIGTPVMKSNGFTPTVMPFPLTESAITGWDATRETSEEARTESDELTLSVTGPAILVACVMSRSDAEIDGTGWTKLVQSAQTTDSTTQRMTVWTKSVTAGEYSAKVTQTSSVRISLSLMAIYHASALTVVDNTNFASVPYTPTATTGKRRLYFVSSAYAQTSPAIPAIVYSGMEGTDFRKLEGIRFSVYYDYVPSARSTPTFTYYAGASSYNSNTANILSIDITEG